MTRARVTIFAILYCAVLIIPSLYFFLTRNFIILPKLEDVSAADIEENSGAVLSDREIAALNQIPATILREFLAYEWSFSVDTSLPETYDAMYDGWLTTGVTDYVGKRIVVSQPDSISHEFGHFLDYLLQFSEYHQTLYEAEADAVKYVLGSYSQQNCREYFAECFSFWITHDNSSEAMQAFKEAAPETYRYFKSLEQDNWGTPADRVRIFVEERGD